MKLTKKQFEKNGEGTVSLIPDNSEDMWHAFNLIVPGDVVRTSTFRKVQSESSTGSRTNEKVKISLAISVEKVDFDSDAGILRLGGKNVEESKFVKLGQHHTVELAEHRSFSLTKDCWDIVFIERLKEATDPAAGADVGAVIMSEGLAHVCLISPSMTLLRAKIEQSIPKKRGAAAAGVDKALGKFFNNVTQAITKFFDFAVVKCVILASPGFVKDEYFEHLMQEAERTGNRVILDNKSKFMLCHSSSGEKYALKDVLGSAEVQARISDTKAAGEVLLMEKFWSVFGSQPERACYGLGHVTYAAEKQAIDTLLLSDSLFRSSDVPTRRRYIELVESVQDVGGKVVVFSSMHVTGEQLDQITGVAAILRFPLPELEEMDGPDDAHEHA